MAVIPDQARDDEAGDWWAQTEKTDSFDQYDRPKKTPRCGGVN
jgi:hypothetical protein